MASDGRCRERKQGTPYARRRVSYSLRRSIGPLRPLQTVRRGFRYAVAAQRGEYRRFDSYGDVIVYEPNGEDRTPIIHRTRFWVEAGKNWYDVANPRYLNGESCGAIQTVQYPMLASS